MFNLQERDDMTYKLKKNFTKEDIDKVLEKIAKKKKGIDMSKFAGKLKLPKDFDVIEWQEDKETMALITIDTNIIIQHWQVMLTP